VTDGDEGLGRDAVTALARKYAALVALRRRRDGGGDPAGGGALKALAGEFPGCLRELDTLGLPELERRARACAAVAGGAVREPQTDWMDWIATYHALLRAALAVRDPARAAAARGDLDALAALASSAAGLAVDAAFVAAVLAPPGGRMGVVVLRALATRFGVAASTIAETLFPVRRESPYTL
jgi:hypothetical protein